MKHASLSRKGKRRCVDRNAIAASAPMSGQIVSNGRLTPEQELYEQIKPLVLFHENAGERAKEIDVQERTLSRRADEFERDGMQSLFPSGERCSRRFVSSSWTYGNTDQGTVEVSWCQDTNCTAWVRLFSVSANEDGASFPVRARLVTTARERERLPLPGPLTSPEYESSSSKPDEHTRCLRKDDSQDGQNRLDGFSCWIERSPVSDAVYRRR